MALFLGIDTSTTGTKALLIDEGGAVVAVGRGAHTLQTPRPLWSEQDPAEWWEATRQSVRQALDEAGATGDDVAAVGLTGQMHGLVLLGRGGDVLRPALLWNDGRAQAECDAIRERVGGLDRLVAETGNDAFAGFTAPKLLWVREHEPEVYADVAHVLLPKDYLRYRLTGEAATDRAGAGGTLLLGLASRDWSDAILDALDVPARLAPADARGAGGDGRGLGRGRCGDRPPRGHAGRGRRRRPGRDGGRRRRRAARRVGALARYVGRRVRPL